MKPLREWIDSLFLEATPQRILFRVDAGTVPGLSFGHLSRCLLVDKVCNEIYGSQSLYVMRDYQEGVQYAQSQGKKISQLPISCNAYTELEFVTRAVKQIQPTWLIHDLPYKHIHEEIFSYCMEQSIHVLFMDDFRFIAPRATVTLNSSIMAPDRVNKEKSRSNRLLLGPDFFLHDLNPDTRKKLDNQKTTVLLTFGGSDPSGLTLKALKALTKETWPQVCFQVMLGPGYHQTQAAISLAKEAKLDCIFLHQPQNQIKHFQEADIVVCAGGRTMYELMALGVPFLPIASASHEAQAVQAFIEQQIIAVGLKKWHEAKFIAELKCLL